MDLIDSHCHLNYDYDGRGLSELLEEARAQGVKSWVTIGTDLVSMPAVAQLAEDWDAVFFTAGVHPHDAKDLAKKDLPGLEAWARRPKCVAVGEIGLDYHYLHSPADVQQERLRWQLELALELNLPVVIHSRDAEEDLLYALEGYARRAQRAPGVIHCFSGTRHFGERCLDLGFFLSFSGIITFKKADEVREVARLAPADRLLVETDSPFLAPVPHRGKKCLPWMLRVTADALAVLRGVSPEVLAQTTAENTRQLFALGQR